jgi:hypothetical protein
MRYLWQAILHRFYMGYWPVPAPTPTLRSQGIWVIDEYNWSRRQMDEYIDPIIHEEINQLLADILD